MGGISVVFRARDRRLHRDVAVKFLLSASSQKDRSAYILGNEARAVARLNHENIVSIFDISTWSGIPFIVMELVDGKPLDLVLGERMPLERATAIFLGITSGIRHAHERGMIHRDLKPSNIFIRADGKPKVLDFGLVWFDTRFSDDGETWTPDLLMLTAGTPTYMSPEQWRGEPQDACTDIWALGMIYHSCSPASRRTRAPAGPTSASAPCRPTRCRCRTPPRSGCRRRCWPSSAARCRSPGGIASRRSPS